MGFDWDTSEMCILMVAKLSVGTARIVINSLHIKGDVCEITPFAFMLLRHAIELYILNKVVEMITN